MLNLKQSVIGVQLHFAASDDVEFPQGNAQFEKDCWRRNHQYMAVIIFLPEDCIIRKQEGTRKGNGTKKAYRGLSF